MHPGKLGEAIIAGSNSTAVWYFGGFLTIYSISGCAVSCFPWGRIHRTTHRSYCGWKCQRGLCPGSPLQRPRRVRGRRGAALDPDHSDELGSHPLILGVVPHRAGWLGGAHTYTRTHSLTDYSCRCSGHKEKVTPKSTLACVVFVNTAINVKDHYQQSLLLLHLGLC